ncbi:MAG TPA: TIGR03118 family protein [Candidatus Polarisedimenticolaceae bacterium]|nr:TIGR03118 family protein [Candidatus Polarisedimenticolaceae bacterium]
MRIPRRITQSVSAAIVTVSAVTLQPLGSASSLSFGGLEDGYHVDYLLSDGTIATRQVDPEFRNGWGLAASGTGPWWVAVNEIDSAAVVDENGTVQGLHVSLSGPPTGIVHWNGDGFAVTDGTNSGPSRFLFALESGKIVGWNPSVGPPAPEQEAFVGVDRSSDGAVYKGLAVARTLDGPRLMATDFHNARVDVFDENFKPVTKPDAFATPRVPPGFAPFGIQTLAGRVFVSYAKQDPEKMDEVAGQGLGMLAAFDTDGVFLGEVAIRGALDAPWGMALAPAAGFGAASGKLLVGNFGDGTIATFRMTDDFNRLTPDGVLRDASHRPIRIDGLWGIAFGNGGEAGSPDSLYFAAGPSGESHGSFGRITLESGP